MPTSRELSRTWGEAPFWRLNESKVGEPKPNIADVIDELELSDFVKVQFEERCFNWHLMKLLESGHLETFDFCYIDGQRTWETDGFAYCLASRLLKPGGWLVINHLSWKFQDAGNVNWVQAMPEERPEHYPSRKGV